ncbi:4F2 cell-surface antigen heavy chain-like [Pimephales promelas]|uniref:4F2 cell-surface antigen heavy chain-like n=1 Tax=Pimephales promelas TaxID=90988 RepID=UPI001955F0FF|nr:4F2 cell-surface antigen heavy chain-like [Pimephales promelas]XP_039515469.1 4F2 cell-surface antigen heavy chain-like [Pimephales promelas]KAG1959286.1 Aamy domain-containing protein [Pimephales promelas]
MNKEDDMKDVELNEMDQEKLPMTGETLTGTEKNGSVKVKVPEDTEVKFTGLSKEELMKVAGTTGWVRTRWALLVLFWLGWVGMLAGAIVIIVQAPRCKPIPEMNWWNEGLLYQISDVNAFSDNGLKGVEEKLDYLSQMKVKGLVLGPIHTVQADQPSTLELTAINPEIGSISELTSLMERAHRKGISIVLDLTPNYEGVSAWFNNAATVAERLKEACVYWLSKGVDGIILSHLNDIANTEAWPSIQDIFNQTDGTKKTALMGSVTGLSVEDVSLLLNRSGVDLLLTELAAPAGSGVRQAQAIQKLYSGHLQTSLGWSLSRSLGSPAVPVRLFHTLLFTLPGTPVFSAGDEIGLKAGEKIQAMWDLESKAEDANVTAKAVQEEHTTLRGFFKALSDLKGKERSLLHGEYVSLHSSATSLAFLRLWDQSERFLVALNWGNDSVTMTLSDSDLPAQARVRATTDAENLAVDRKVSVEKLELGPKQAVLLSYPYAG